VFPSHAGVLSFMDGFGRCASDSEAVEADLSEGWCHLSAAVRGGWKRELNCNTEESAKVEVLRKASAVEGRIRRWWWISVL